MSAVAILLYPKVRDNPIILINLGYKAYKFVTAGQMSVQHEGHGMGPKQKKIAFCLKLWNKIRGTLNTWEGLTGDLLNKFSRGKHLKPSLPLRGQHNERRACGGFQRGVAARVLRGLEGWSPGRRSSPPGRRQGHSCCVCHWVCGRWTSITGLLTVGLFNYNNAFTPFSSAMSFYYSPTG